MSLRLLRRHIGRLAVFAFTGQTVSGDLRRLVSAFDLAGVLYRADNLAEPRQIAELSRELASLDAEWPLWIGVALEGGPVAPMPTPFTSWPAPIALGRRGETELAERFGDAMALELRAVGINVNYAPVLDLATNPRNTAVADRALSERPEEAARLGRAIVSRLQAAGVAACAKHFPGLGDASLGGNGELPFIEHGPDRLSAVELEPFRAAIDADVAMIMAAHVMVPCYDEEQPASMSRRIIDGLLKRELGYQGVVISTADATVQTIAAGADVVMLEQPDVDAQVAALEAAIHALESGDLREKRIDDAFARQRRIKERLLTLKPATPAPLDIIGCAAHQAVATEMARWL